MSATIETLYFGQGPLTFSAQALGAGPVVVCLHGFPDNAGSFRYQLPALANAGYRGIALTLRGYEPGSIPADGDYSMEAVAGDVVTLTRALNEGPVHLIGHDWGAAIAYNAAAAAPECFRSLTTMAVPHAGRFARDGLRIFKQLRLSWYMGFLISPGSQITWCNAEIMRLSANFGAFGAGVGPTPWRVSWIRSQPVCALPRWGTTVLPCRWCIDREQGRGAFQSACASGAVGRERWLHRQRVRATDGAG